MSDDKPSEVILKDGQSLRVRSINPDDKQRLSEFFYRLSPRTRYLRFRYTKDHITDAELADFTFINPPARHAFVATMGEAETERIVAVARWYQSPDPSRAEIILVVEDSIQFRGVGTVLLDYAAEQAKKLKIREFVSTVLAENAYTLEVYDECGFKADKKLDAGVYGITLHLDKREEYERKHDLREHVARSAGVKRFMYPRNVAVIGASRDPESVGGAVFQNMLKCGFKGTVFPVNPKATSVGGVMCYPTVLDIPADVDLAVVVVAARFVLEVVDQCGKKGVRSMVIISAGFGEAGHEGKLLEEKLHEKLLGYGIRLIGPNCLGILNTDPDGGLNATFSPIAPPKGNLSIGTQSGALGLALIDYARSMDMGLANFVSIGNRIDISGDDLIEYWQDDPNTDIILLYMESLGNPRTFSRIARRVSRKKPVIAVKAGKSEVGAKAASSHTGALAASDVAVEAMFKQAGVIRVGTIEAMFNVARAISRQPIPTGNRVAILTNAGGPGVLAADACEGWDLKVTPLSADTQKKLREILPPSAAVANPVDMIASATPDQYAKSLGIILEDPGIDSVVVIYIPPLVTHPEDVAASLRQAMCDYKGNKPVLACFMMLEKKQEDIILCADKKRRLPVYTFPEDAVQAIARGYQCHEFMTRREGVQPEFKDIDREAARKYFDSAAKAAIGAGGWLMPEHALELLKQYGIPVPAFAVATTPDEAAKAASSVGFPLAMKLRSLTIVHKTDVGGIALNIKSEQEAKQAFIDMQGRLKAAAKLDQMQGVLMQPMVKGGTEMIVGMAYDAVFGPLVMAGMGGVQVELLKDISFSLHPLVDVDPERMINGLKGLPLLTGWRGSEPCDIESLKDTLLRFSELIEDFPEIDQMEINPLLVLPKGKGCSSVDARVKVKTG